VGFVSAPPRTSGISLVALLLILPLAVTAEAPGDLDLESWMQVGSYVWRFDPAGAEAGPADASGFLVSTERYGDFELSVEFWIEDDTNSGVFVRCGEIGSLEAVNPTDCYEINIYDSHPIPDYRTGSIVTRAVPVATVDTLRHWSRMQIRAVGARIEVIVNGTATATIDDARTVAGPIALQYAGKGLLRFRALRIVPAEAR
jgi:3-keto-disaccharide hydrolase